MAFMDHIVPYAVSFRQPQTVVGTCYRAPVQVEDPKTYLWATLCRLTGIDAASVDDMHRALKKSIGRGTVQRIREGDTSIGLDALRQIAGVLELQVWQLLVPDVKREDASRPTWGRDWPLRLVKLDRLKACDPEELGYISAAVNRALAECEETRLERTSGGAGTVQHKHKQSSQRTA